MSVIFVIRLGNIMLALLIKSCFYSSDLTSTHMVVCMCIFVNLIICIFVDIIFDVLWGFMVERAMLSKMILCKLLVVFRVFLLLSVCEFGDDSAKSTVCESLSDNSFDEVYKDLEILLGSCTPLV